MYFFKTLTPALGAIQLAGHVAAQTNNQKDPCREVALAQAQAIRELDLEREGDIGTQALFDAETAFECVKSVPLDGQAATEVLELSKKYVSFQSSLAWLKDPPKSYQAPAVDVLARIDAIIQNIADDKYTNHYELELDMVSIERDARESHFGLPKRLMGLFQWQLAESLVSVSRDGKELPQVYASSDIMGNVEDASPITELAGQSIFEYMRNHLEKGQMNTGLVEPHAEWNSLMADSATQFGSVGTSTFVSLNLPGFQSLNIYNGPSLKGRFANGTEFEWKYRAGSGADLTKQELSSASDIVSNRILQPDASLFAVAAEGPAPPKPISLRNATALPYPNFPQDPVVIQDDFGNGGTVSGYLLKDASVGVLSLPSFGGDADPSTFHDAVADFIAKAKAAKMKKIVIDVSGNGGGRLFLGFDVFKQFFPKAKMTPLFHARATPETRILGISQTYTADQSNPRLGAVMFNTNRMMKPDGKAWDGYDEFFGPFELHDDNFTAVARARTSAADMSFELQFRVPDYEDEELGYEQPWAAEDVVLLTNGLCHSTCFILGNLLKLDAGVKSVVVGGLPMDGPMQAVSGTRGSSAQTWGAFSSIAAALSQGTSNLLLRDMGLSRREIDALPAPVESAPWRNLGNAGVNGLNTFNPDNQDVPRQFVYEAANCRLFYTGDMIRNVTQLWKAAAKFAGGDESLCVSGSVDGPGSGSGETLTESPGFTYNQTWSKASTPAVFREDKGEEKAEGEGEGGDKGEPSAASGHAVSTVGLLGVVVFMLCL